MNQESHFAMDIEFRLIPICDFLDNYLDDNDPKESLQNRKKNKRNVNSFQKLDGVGPVDNRPSTD